MSTAPLKILLFDSTSAALQAEKLLKAQGLPFKIIPVPRHISSDCGVCIRFRAEDEGSVTNSLEGRVPVNAICSLD